MSIPSDIASYLTPDEKIVMIGRNGGHIYATNKRLIFKTEWILGGKEIVEVSYRHISSIEYEKKISLRYIVAGICIIVLGLLVNYFRPQSTDNLYLFGMILSNWLNILSIVLGICGAILIIIGVLLSLRPPIFTIHIVGRKPIELRGKRLEELFRIVRQYREEIIAPEKVTP